MNQRSVIDKPSTEVNKAKLSVFAPSLTSMGLHLVHPFERYLEMKKNAEGYFVADVDIPPGTRYFLRPNHERDVPDVSSHYQPLGVHGPSEVTSHDFPWSDADWKGIRQKDLIIYELHVGTFTPEGTFEAIIARLDHLVDLGVNAIELMPLAQFPGRRNWGYDGVYPYAVQNTYGGPAALKRLVDEAHKRKLCVFLDVVYNHFGPEGNYAASYSPFFSDRYYVPWGKAINFDNEWSDGVRRFYIDNLTHWFRNYHIDGLRLDAIHTMFDISAIHILEALNEQTNKLQTELGRMLYLFAESDLNNPKVVMPPSMGGYGFAGQWLDDFHHALYVLLNPEDNKRYEDFGTMEQLVKAFRDGFVLDGGYVKFRKKHYGASSAGISGEKFIAFNQNHDQIGNRPRGDRLSMLVGFEKLKLAAAALLLSPYLPMLFMGEEYGDDTPFFYFVSHSDEQLIKAVAEGRKKEFSKFGNKFLPPDAQSEQTFLDSKIHWEKRTAPNHSVMLAWVKALIHLRKSNSTFQCFEKSAVEVSSVDSKVLLLVRSDSTGTAKTYSFLNLAEEAVYYNFPDEMKLAVKLLDSTDYRADRPSLLRDDQNNYPTNARIKIEPLSVSVFSSILT